MIKIILKDLPKVSLNQWYSGKHWNHRQKTKKLYTLQVKSQFKRVFSKDNQYLVHYAFEFKKNPLDASNCIAMVKMIEDIIFQDDKWDIIDIGSITSRKGKENKVTIKVEIKGENDQ
jgi:hypothetical protein